jgi:hypothetical protein
MGDVRRRLDSESKPQQRLASGRTRERNVSTRYGSHPASLEESLDPKLQVFGIRMGEPEADT